MPEIEDNGGGVTVRPRPSRYLPPQRVARDLSERQQAILMLLEAKAPEGLALREITAQLIPTPQIWEVREELTTLKQLGLIENRGHGRGAYWHFP